MTSRWGEGLLGVQGGGQLRLEPVADGGDLGL